MSRLPVVAIVGRPNVGKSTLFNRIVGHRLAIVADEAGVTRDRNFAQTDWSGHSFILIDTGGLVEGSDEPLHRAVRGQVLAAMDEADLVVFLVDGKAGIHPLDQRIADLLRKSERPVLLAVNKVDELPDDTARHDFWELGLGTPRPVSAATGKGSGDLLDEIVDRLPATPLVPEPEALRVAIIGKPNVGKSSFLNRLVGEERVVVSDEPGTTRDAVDTRLRYHGRDILFGDTAGLRRQSRVDEALEYYSTVRTVRVVENADACLLLVDATEPLHKQDIRIAELAWEKGCGLILVANKWDLVETDEHSAELFRRHVTDRVPFLRRVPILYTSALTGLRVRDALDTILRVEEERRKRIPTHEVNEVLRELVNRQPPPHSQGRDVRLRYATQVGTAPPLFVVFSNFPKAVPSHYIRYLENGFRDRWGFVGVPMRIGLRSGDRSGDERRERRTGSRR